MIILGGKRNTPSHEIRNTDPRRPHGVGTPGTPERRTLQVKEGSERIDRGKTRGYLCDVPELTAASDPVPAAHAVQEEVAHPDAHAHYPWRDSLLPR